MEKTQAYLTWVNKFFSFEICGVSNIITVGNEIHESLICNKFK